MQGYFMQPISRLLILHKDNPQPENAGRELLPWLRARQVEGVLLSAGADAMTMRATHRPMMSRAVDSTWVG